MLRRRRGSRRRARLTALVALFAALARMALGCPHANAETVVIVNRGNPVEQISLQDLQRMYRGVKKEWEVGFRVVLLLPEPHSEAMTTLAKSVLGVKSESAVWGYYLKAIFQGKLTAPPAQAEDAARAVSKVASRRGAISLVDDREVPAEAPVRVLRIRGLK